MTIKSYKCHNCGAGLSFKPELQKFKCDYCLSEYTEKEIKDLYKEKNKEDVAIKQKNDVDAKRLATYNCNSCGACVVTDDTTTSTFCYYCHNPVIISDRLSGEFLPKKMIPFVIGKEKAQEIFLDWVSDKKYVPKEFSSNSQLEKITGIYLPYWWTDCVVDVTYEAEAENVKVWQEENQEHKETKKFKIVRKGHLDINNVEELAFTKIDEKLLNGIAPYTESAAIEFSMPYLSGFFAEQYNIDKSEISPKIDAQIKNYTNSLINDTVKNFTSVNETTNISNIISKETNYTLLPAWILTFLFEGKTYVFAVNGQTGKSFGELPVDNKKIIGVSAIIFIIVLLVLLAGGMLIW